MVYDASRHLVLLFGGDSVGNSFCGDTWAWDGENWMQIGDIGPSARAGHALAFNDVSRRTVLFGGVAASGVLGDTWEWDGETWTQMADSGPAARRDHAMAFDSARQRVVLFGGAVGDTEFLGDTWEWDGDQWVQVEDTGPSPRHGHALTFDWKRQRIVLFGGLDANGPDGVGDTWEWNGELWTQVADFGPEPCTEAAIVFRDARALLFGGASGATPLTQFARAFGYSWEWDGKHWTARQDMGPGPRFGHAMAYDSRRKRVVLFGGARAACGEPPATKQLRDTWEQFETGTVSPPPPVDEPPAPSPAPMTAELQSLTVEPETAVASQTLTATVILAPPPPPRDISVSLTIEVRGETAPLGSLTVPAGQLTQQQAIPLPPEFDPPLTEPTVVTIAAASGDSVVSAQFTIVP
jgi:hypothetical protein